MIVPGVLSCSCPALLPAQQDCPQATSFELRKQGIEIDSGKKGGWAVFRAAAGQTYRVWMLS